MAEISKTLAQSHARLLLIVSKLQRAGVAGQDGAHRARRNPCVHLGVSETESELEPVGPVPLAGTARHAWLVAIGRTSTTVGMHDGPRQLTHPGQLS